MLLLLSVVYGSWRGTVAGSEGFASWAPAGLGLGITYACFTFSVPDGPPWDGNWEADLPV